MRRSHQHTSGQFLLAGILLGLILTLVLPQAPLAQEMDRKLAREIRIFEAFINDMLIESPNWLVPSGGPAHGTYLEGYGVLFSFETSLNAGEHGIFGRDNDFGFKRLGQGIIEWHNDGENDEDIEELFEDNPQAYKKYKDKKEKRAGRLYQEGKDELREVMLDAGEVFASLSAGEWVTMIVVLDDHDYFDKNKLDRIVLSVKAGDLQMHASEQITSEQLFSRMSETEY